MKKKGVILFVVLITVLIAAILVNIILSFILSHYRFTYHQSSRIQAYYASLAGMNLAQENLRTGRWTPAGSPYTLCKSGCTVNDLDMPYTVTITIKSAGSSNDCKSPPAPAGGSCIKITTNYKYNLIGSP